MASEQKHYFTIIILNSSTLHCCHMTQLHLSMYQVACKSTISYYRGHFCNPILL